MGALKESCFQNREKPKQKAIDGIISNINELPSRLYDVRRTCVFITFDGRSRPFKYWPLNDRCFVEPRNVLWLLLLSPVQAAIIDGHVTYPSQSKKAKEQQLNGPSELEFLQWQLKPYKWYHRICPPMHARTHTHVKTSARELESKQKKICEKWEKRSYCTDLQFSYPLGLHCMAQRKNSTVRTYGSTSQPGLWYFERLAFEFEVFIVKCIKNVSAWMRVCARPPNQHQHDDFFLLLFSRVSGFQTDFQPTI